MTQEVVGRGPELARIDAFLAGAPAGARGLVIEGEAGMGKTTLWLAGLENAADRAWRVLSARPSDAEASFAYAGLGDLLESVHDDAFGSLPAPQRRALRVALLRDEPEGAAPDAHAVAVAFLNALRAMSLDRPTIVAVDDVQWLDSPSALALGFAIRRMGEESMLFLLARRVEEPASLPLVLERPYAGEPLERIAVGPLDLVALQQLLETRLGVRFSRTTLGRIQVASGGNPLFALELGRAIQGRPAGGEAGEDLPMPEELIALLAGRIASLPGDTRDALAVVAALAAPTLELLSRALGRPAEQALRPALEAQVVALDVDRIRFAHPLHAVAVRSRTPSGRRREIHARLAEIVTDPEEQARHLALAASGPDEAVASALEAAAERARSRGAPDAAVELAALACRLTPADRREDLRRRALVEAQYVYFAGDFIQARSLIEDVLATCPPGEARGRALMPLGMIVSFGFDSRAGVRLLVAALAEAGDDDRLRMRCEGMMTGVLDLLGEDVREALVHGHAELELAERLGDEVHLATALRGIARNEQRLTGLMPSELIERAMALEPSVMTRRGAHEWPSVALADMLSWTDNLAAGLERWDWLSQQALERGEVRARSDILARAIPYECAAGLLRRALAHANEGFELARDAGSPVWKAVLLADRALVEAHLGDEPATRRDAEEAIRLAKPTSALLADRTAAWALGLLELSLGNAARAHEHLGPLVESRRAAGITEPGELRFVADESEALIGVGRLAEAETLLAWFEGLARSSGRVYALAACDRCRGLLTGARGDIDGAIAALEESRTRYGTIADPFGLGRTLLALGSAQRRALRRHEARESLEASLAAFEALGAKLWAGRARAELARIGGRHAVGDELTPSERQVAALVAEGRTNREVAAALVLSERTIESHLSSIYAKLQVRSRAELAHRFNAETPA